MNVSVKELQKIPYVSHIPSDGRTIFLGPYFDEDKKRFVMYVPGSDNTLTWIWAEPGQSYYFGKSKFNETIDIYIELINVIVQNYSYGSIERPLIGILNDIVNCSAFFEKYFILHAHYLHSKDIFTSSLISTEIECFFGNIRSMYDLLQNIIKILWKLEKKSELNDSFAGMALKSKEELKTKYNLTDSLINYYNNSAGLFLIIRAIRDKIYHGGYATNIIFCDGDGFAIQNTDPTFSELSHIWPKEKIKENGLVSLLALFSYITKQIIKNFDELSLALIESIESKPSISNTHKVFFRGPYINHLNNLDKYLSEQWYIPPEH